MFSNRILSGLSLLAVSLPGAWAADPPAGPWYKGNLHTHSWWSDGSHPPEMVAAWYKENGYHFLVVTDHGTVQDGEKWVTADKRRAEGAAEYEKAFPPGWVVKRCEGEKTEYRLKTLEEYRARYEEPGRFLLIRGDEISDACDNKPVHLNGINLRKHVPPQHGRTVAETIQNNVNAVLAQARTTGQLMLVQINHPNFGWALTVDDLAPVEGTNLFELCNGHPGVRNEGDKDHLSVERMWDVVLTRRLAELKKPPLFGTGTDDMHNLKGDGAGPGRAWVMVRAPQLTAQAICRALREGDFYCTTGVEILRTAFDGRRLEIEIRPRPGVTYRTQFIGTTRDYGTSVPGPAGDPPRPAAERFSPKIGQVLAEQAGTRVSYALRGDELYVRAKVISDARHPRLPGQVEVAWTQPVIPDRK